MVGSNVLTGLVVPVHWFPDWMALLARATPFPSMLQAPVDILSGRATGSASLEVVATQAFWLIAMLLVGRLVTARATRKLVVQGG
jgi:ABC-2 type transport system permease protein